MTWRREEKEKTAQQWEAEFLLPSAAASRVQWQNVTFPLVFYKTMKRRQFAGSCFIDKMIFGGLAFPPAARSAPGGEASIFFYRRLAHHYVFYCWGDERRTGTKGLWLGVLPPPNLIGWPPGWTTAAASSGTKSNNSKTCKTMRNSWRFIKFQAEAFIFILKSRGGVGES